MVDDANDNTPIFLQPRYDAVLTSAKDNFTQPLVVKVMSALLTTIYNLFFFPIQDIFLI